MPTSKITLTLNDTTRKSVARIARRKHITPSHAMREAVEAWVERNEATPEPAKIKSTLYERVADLIGVVHGGNPRRSENTGRQVSEILKRKYGRS